MDFEEVSVYGLTLKYPKGWWLYPSPRAFSPKEGSIIIRPRDKEISAAMMWYDLKEEKDRSLEEYLRDLNREYQKRCQEFQELEEYRKNINGHECLLSHVKYMVKVKRLSTKRKVYERLQCFVKCEKSERFIILYVTTTPELFMQERSVIEKIVESFKCH